ncbi:hypothetical protein TNIN_242361, partial [Trichonephila inaurata madagascariensis]
MARLRASRSMESKFE